MFNSWVDLKGLLPEHFFDFSQPLLAGKGDPEGNLTIDTNDFHDVHGDLTQYSVQFSSVQSLSRVQLFATPWTAALQASLSITNSQSLLKLMSIESVTPSNHLILCCPLLLLPSIFLSIRVFSKSPLVTAGGQSIGVSASASVLPMNIQD